MKCRMDLPSSSVVKNLPADSGNTGDMGSIHISGRSSKEEEMATHSRLLPEKIP